MISITVRGIPCSFDDGALDDFDMLELVAKWEAGDPTAMIGVTRRIFGAEQLDNIKDSLRDENGVCKASTMGEFLGECMDAAAKAKRAEAKN